MDPLADRLYIFATLLAFAVRGVVPWVFLVAIVARDLLLTACLLVLRRYGYGPPPVHYLGKTATFILLCRVPDAAAGQGTCDSTFWFATGWGFAWWGIVLYWIAGRLLPLSGGRTWSAGRSRNGRGVSRIEPSAVTVRGGARRR